MGHGYFPAKCRIAMIIIGRKLGIDIKCKYMEASSFCNEFLSNQFLFRFAICMQIREMKEYHVWRSLTNCFFSAVYPSLIHGLSVDLQQLTLA